MKSQCDALPVSDVAEALLIDHLVGVRKGYDIGFRAGLRAGLSDRDFIDAIEKIAQAQCYDDHALAYLVRSLVTDREKRKSTARPVRPRATCTASRTQGD